MINKYNELTQYVPKRYWGNDDVQKLIYKKLTDRLNWLEGIFEEIVNNAYIKYMNEEALSKIEKEFKVRPDSEMTLEDRKAVLISILRGVGVTNIAKLKKVAESFTNGKVDIITDNPHYHFTVKFVSEFGIPPRIEDIKNTIEKIKPAHLGVDYKFKYNTVYDLRQFTVEELRQYTVDELRQKELQHLGLLKYLTDKNGNKLVDKKNNKLITFNSAESKK